jgi:FixJ family two-component response regulator
MNRTIAVVDDDVGMLKSIERLLVALGYKPRLFESAEKFLSETAAVDADCLILDVNLGGMSGLELRRRLAGNGRNIPVIFVTASEDELTRTQADEIGCVAFLPKPFPAQALVDALRKVHAAAA